MLNIVTLLSDPMIGPFKIYTGPGHKAQGTWKRHKNFTARSAVPTKG